LILTGTVGKALGQIGVGYGEAAVTAESSPGSDGGSASGACSAGTVGWVRAHDNLLGAGLFNGRSGMARLVDETGTVKLAL